MNTECNPKIEDSRIHKTLKSLQGYSNVYFCPECGVRFRTEVRESDKSL